MRQSRNFASLVGVESILLVRTNRLAMAYALAEGLVH